MKEPACNNELIRRITVDLLRSSALAISLSAGEKLTPPRRFQEATDYCATERLTSRRCSGSSHQLKQTPPCRPEPPAHLRTGAVSSQTYSPRALSVEEGPPYFGIHYPPLGGAASGSMYKLAGFYRILALGATELASLFIGGR